MFLSSGFRVSADCVRSATMVSEERWDDSYIWSNCTGLPPPGTNVDNSPGTWCTNYAICGVSIVSAALASWGRPCEQSALLIAYFVPTGASFACAGVIHQFYSETDDITTPFLVLTVATGLLLVLGNAALGLVGAAAGSGGWESGGCWRGIAIVSLALLLLLPILMATLLACGVDVVLVMTIAGAPLVLTLLFTSFVWCRALWARGRRGWWRLRRRAIGDAFKAAAPLLMLASLVVQASLGASCGKGGYDVCWLACALPAPAFNHNALFHVLYAVGVLMLGVGENLAPEPCAPPSRDYLRAQDASGKVECH